MTEPTVTLPLSMFKELEARPTREAFDAALRHGERQQAFLQGWYDLLNEGRLQFDPSRLEYIFSECDVVRLKIPRAMLRAMLVRAEDIPVLCKNDKLKDIIG